MISSFELEGEASIYSNKWWSLRSDLEKHWFRSRGAKLACQAFVCVLRLQTDITTLLNTSIVKVSKPIILSLLPQ